MNKKLKKKGYHILIASLLFASAFIFSTWKEIQLILFLTAYLAVGTEILKKAFQGIRNGRIFDENFLMMIATFGAFALHEYPEAVAVMLFFQIGEFFQGYAVNRSRKSIAALMDIRPEYARIKQGTEWQEISPEEVKPGEIILIRPGEKVPLDAQVILGESSVNTVALTGESLPRDIAPGDQILSGSINISGLIEARVLSSFKESTVAKILDLVENATHKKAPIEHFITKFAHYYTPAVVMIAFFLAIFPPFLIAGQTFSEWGYRAITFLVISCPCALVISIPLSFFGGLGAASKCGILIKGGNYLEALSHVKCVVFDKTGTLTQGSFAVRKINAIDISEEELLRLAAHAEYYSTHPIAQSIKMAYGKKINKKGITAVTEIPGRGLKMQFEGKEIAVGNIQLMKEMNISVPLFDEPGTPLFMAINNRYEGCIIIDDFLKEESVGVIKKLKKEGVKKTVILSGDCEKAVQYIANLAGIDEACGALLPADKIAWVESLQKTLKKGEKLLFVGDGINDAPVLARADIGVAMGGVGSDAAIEAADVVIMNDSLSKLLTAMSLSRATVLIAQENIVIALGIKFIVLGLGAMGFVSIWAAVFADVGVTLIAVLNAMRILGFYKKCL